MRTFEGYSVCLKEVDENYLLFQAKYLSRRSGELERGKRIANNYYSKSRVYAEIRNPEGKLVGMTCMYGLNEEESNMVMKCKDEGELDKLPKPNPVDLYDSYFVYFCGIDLLENAGITQHKNPNLFFGLYYTVFQEIFEHLKQSNPNCKGMLTEVDFMDYEILGFKCITEDFATHIHEGLDYSFDFNSISFVEEEDEYGDPVIKVKGF